MKDKKQMCNLLISFISSQKRRESKEFFFFFLPPPLKRQRREGREIQTTLQHNRHHSSCLQCSALTALSPLPSSAVAISCVCVCEMSCRCVWFPPNDVTGLLPADWLTSQFKNPADASLRPLSLSPFPTDSSLCVAYLVNCDFVCEVAYLYLE